MRPEISVIIPVFNEEEGIADVIRDVKDNLTNCSYSYEIIVVDDASEDRTAEAARTEGASVIATGQNRGYGFSIKTGVENSNGKFIAIIDGDGSYAGKDLLDLTKYIQDNDMVVGARTKKGARQSILRKIDKFFLTLLASYLVEAKIPDLNSGLRIMRREKLNRFLKILPNRFSFTTTTTIAFLNSNLKVSYIPVGYNKRRGKSKIRPIRDTLNFIQLIIRAVMYFNPLRIFVPVSLLLFIAGITILLYSWLFLPKVMDITTVVVLLTSVQILAIGMLADLLIRRMD